MNTRTIKKGEASASLFSDSPPKRCVGTLYSTLQRERVAFRSQSFRTAPGKRGNLPRPKKHATGMFFASLCSAGLFDSRTAKKDTHRRVCVFFTKQ